MPIKKTVLSRHGRIVVGARPERWRYGGLVEVQPLAVVTERSHRPFDVVDFAGWWGCFTSLFVTAM
jgi:hypothetical protein